MNRPLGQSFRDALVYASQLHQEQIRKGTEGIGGPRSPAIPYIAHLLGVTALVLEHGGRETEAIAALLHDAVEDQGGPPRLAEIEARFGAEVAHIVNACTDGDRWSVGADGSPLLTWRDRKEAYVRHLPKETASVLLVSASDKRHNAQAILDDLRASKRIADTKSAQVAEASLWARFKPGRGATLRYYEALSKAYLAAPATPSHPGLTRLVAEFARTVIDLTTEAGPNDTPCWQLDP